MRLHRGIATLAVVSALAGTATPAYAFQPTAPGSGTPTPARVQQPSDTGAGDVPIAVGVAGGLAVLATGGIAKRRHSRGHRAPSVTGS